MADNKKMSVEEVLAACRRMDGADKSAAPPPATSPAAEVPATEAEVQESTAAPAASPPPAAAPPTAKKPAAQMSVAEMLAAARGEKAAKAPAAPAAEASAEAPAAKPAAPAKKPAAQMSVAEMLAAARAEKSGAAPSAAAKPAAPKPAAEKPAAAKPAAEKPAAAAKAPAAKAAKPGAGGAQDTASILAAARGGAKPGPMSKAEAAAKGQAPPAAKKAPTLPPLPERPAYLEPTVAQAPATSRRSFFTAVGAAAFGTALALGFSSLFVTNLLWLLGFARFMFPNILTEPPTVFKVGFPADYAPGQVETKYVAQFGIWLVRYEYNGQPQIYAIRTVCTHLGCTPNWLEAEQKFKCPCHGSGFYKDGINFEGPAPRPLERYAIRISDDGQLEVDKSRKFQEELGQWKDPASFVPV